MDAIEQLEGVATSRPPSQQAVAVAGTPPAPLAPVLPTLEGFAARFPQDLYSEGDLLDLNEE